MPKLTEIPHERFVEQVRTLATRIAADPWRPAFLVGIGRGGLAPAVYLGHAAGLPVLSVDYSSRVPDFADVLLGVLGRRAATGERLLLVDDINDTGGTIAALRRALAAAGAPAGTVRVATLIDNLRSAERVDYAAQTIDRAITKDWFVFPWEALAPRVAIEEDAAEVPERTA